MHLLATVFIPPHGKQEIIEIKDVAVEDKEYFVKNNIDISMEELSTGVKVVYADWGNRMTDGTPKESMVFSRDNETCASTLKRLRLVVELEKENNL